MDSVTQSALIALIGLIAGLVGGLTGLGGSIIILPGLAILVGYANETHTEQHTYQAAAMAVNFLVAVPAVWRHTNAGAVRKDLLVLLLPPAVVCIVIGVLVSDRIQGDVLVKILAVVIAVMVVSGEISNRLRTKEPSGLDDTSRIRRATPAIFGTSVTTGFLAGLLGVGGGVTTVTGLQVLGKIPIRQAIAASAALMCLTAPVGAIVKMSTLDQHNQSAIDAITLVGLLGPAAVIGSLTGSWLVHKLPVKIVRPIVSLVLLAAAAKLGGLIG
ncbi:MAG: sulfite exporter TauE/SafE family protein [Phycisphaera sp.]|nr:MAG: sulfite exporter TauE/SafE family protein [Phycisphaera sp.]